MSSTVFRALGLMSGTSMDGIDAALIETDGKMAVRPLAARWYPYEPAFRARLAACLGRRGGADDFEAALAERELTELHAEAVRKFFGDTGRAPDNVDLIGFHGQSIFHRPEEGVTVQIGDGELLARLTGISVVNDFRSADVKAGGQGAPLVPLYHRALAAGLPKPVAIINIGGVANVTYIGGEDDAGLLAFDIGPGNAMIDDWMQRHALQPYDRDGELAAEGRVDPARVQRFLEDPYFAKRPPKSLDRNAFHGYMPEDKYAADGAATLTMMAAAGIASGLRLLPRPPRAIYLCGGGRHNRTLRGWIGKLAGTLIGAVEDLGWNGDSLEAEAFAYLAVRSKLGLPLTLPGTTGVARPTTGGVLHEAPEARAERALARGRGPFST